MVLSPSRLAVFVSCGGLLLWLGRDGNFNVSALFELHIISMLVGKCIFNAEISMSGIGPANGNLCLFRLARTWRWDDFVDCSRHGGTWRFRNSRFI